MSAERLRLPLVLAFALALAFVPAVAQAGATITIINTNAAGEGFNDPTPADPIGGNTGTTLGQQRLIAFKAAADYWASVISSPVEIRVDAKFSQLDCSATSAVLGSAGANYIHADFAGAPRANTWYPDALADKLAGEDQNPGEPDINANFTSAFDSGCPFPKKWYYGLDGNPGFNQTDFVTTVTHELAHGLGFMTFANTGTGALANGKDDAFEIYLKDQVTGKLWPDMTDSERKASAVDTNNLLWAGPQAIANTGQFFSGIAPGGYAIMYAPNPREAGSSVSHFDKSFSPNELMEPVYTGANHVALLADKLLFDVGWSASGPAPPAATWILPSSARGPGKNSAFYTTDLTIGNRGGTDATYTLKFLGHDVDGTAGQEKTFTLASNRMVTYADVLNSVFGLTADYGAIRITSSSASLSIVSQTSTPGFGGTFGQSVPAFGTADMISSGNPRSIVGIRQDAAFRTNLVLVNTGTSAVTIDLLLLSDNSFVLATKSISLGSLQMTQLGPLTEAMGVSGAVSKAQLVLSTQTPGGSFAAYAAVIDNATNDPRTLLAK